jgi:hypothetical protein
MRSAEVGKWKWECGSRKGLNAEVVRWKWEVGMRKLEVGMRKSECGSRNAEVGKRNRCALAVEFVGIRCEREGHRMRQFSYFYIAHPPVTFIYIQV